MNSSWDYFINLEQRDRERVDFKLIYVDMTGDLIAGLMLSQIIYWNLPAKDGTSRLRARHDGQLWLAKSREDWWDECRISPKQVDRAIDILESKGFVERKIYKFNGAPMIHLRLLREAVLAAWDTSILPKSENGYSQNGNMDIDERAKSLTEITTEITTCTDAPAIAGCADAQTPTPSLPEKKRRTRISDPRSKTPAIQCVRGIMNNRYPPVELYDEIIAILGETPDGSFLADCRREWVARGYNAHGWNWLRDWYKNGSIPQIAARKNAEPEPVGGMVRWG